MIIIIIIIIFWNFKFVKHIIALIVRVPDILIKVMFTTSTSCEKKLCILK